MSDRELAIAILIWEQEGAKLGGPLNDLIEEIKQLFVEQACEAIDKVFNNGNYVSVNRFDIKQAIKDKFK